MSYEKFRLMMFVLLSLMIGCGGGEEGGRGGEKIQFSFPEGINPDIPILLDKMSAICADRWTIRFEEGDMIYLESKDKALGAILGYSSDGKEREYTLDTSFKIVDKVTAAQVSKIWRQYDDLRKQGKAIKHTEMKGSVRYEPQGRDQRALVLKIEEAGEKVGDVPEFRYKSVYLSERYTMSFFFPKKQNAKALQYKKDIDDLYNLFDKLNWWP